MDINNFPFSPSDDVNGITRYVPESGEIIGSLWGDTAQVDANKERYPIPYVDGVYSADTHYIKNGVPTLREEQQTTLNEHTLYQLPPNASIFINTTEYEVNSSTAELEFDQPGSYKVRIVCWPYLDKEFTIEN